MEVIPTIIISVVGSLGYLIRKKYKYKKLKKSLYELLKNAISELDFKKIFEAIEKIKLFDDDNSDKNSKPFRGILEILFFRKRKCKLDKLEKKFGLSKKNISDIESIKKYCENLKNNKNNNNQTKIIYNNELKKIDENEKSVVKIKNNINIDVDKILNQNLKKYNTHIFDQLNLTKIINDINEEYKILFEKTFEDNINIKNIFKSNIKKQFL